MCALVLYSRKNNHTHLVSKRFITGLSSCTLKLRCSKPHVTLSNHSTDLPAPQPQGPPLSCMRHNDCKLCDHATVMERHTYLVPFTPLHATFFPSGLNCCSSVKAHVLFRTSCPSQQTLYCHLSLNCLVCQKVGAPPEVLVAA